jgi:hypothetical protein
MQPIETHPLIADLANGARDFHTRTFFNATRYPHIDRWVAYDHPATKQRAMQYARGLYQRNLLRGVENVSGSSLKGKAKQWTSAYARSRENLLERLRDADFNVRIVRCGQRHVLVITEETN